LVFDFVVFVKSFVYFVMKSKGVGEANDAPISR